MVKKSSVFFAITAGVAAYAVTKKVLSSDQSKVKAKLSKRKVRKQEFAIITMPVTFLMMKLRNLLLTA